MQTIFFGLLLLQVIFCKSIETAEMNKIGVFLKEAKKLLQFKESVIFVIGNESCDLDSAVSAISLAYFYTVTKETPKNLSLTQNERFLPVLNIKRVNLPLKTEVTYFMQSNGINPDDLICW